MYGRVPPTLRRVFAAFATLAVHVGVESVRDLVQRARPEASAVGIAIAALSLVLMPLLARSKRLSLRCSALGSCSSPAPASTQAARRGSRL